MNTVSIHQPVYLPWLGFFKKIISSDIFVFLDDVQYEKNGVQNRNKIRTSEGDAWLTIPVSVKSTTLLKDVKINHSMNWNKKHSKSIENNYSKAKFFYNYWDEFEKCYQKKFDKLIELNLEIIKFLMDKFKIQTKIIFSSELNISEKGSERILQICKSLDANSYLSGIGGKKYLGLDSFKKNDISVNFQNFQHPVYNQVHQPFHPNMSAIDLLYNEGEKSEVILKNAKNF
jgi:hypothetical protein